jgi:glycosyltransferase involved in cell wall biosynthesis
MPFHIAIDCRRIKDFGVGTYIRNLTRALTELDRENTYSLVVQGKDLKELQGFPENFRPVTWEHPDTALRDHLALPYVLRRTSARIFHLPSHNAPLLMVRPYIITVHDLSSILYEAKPGWRSQIGRYRVRRNLLRAAKVIAVSNATRRDVIELLGIDPRKIRQIYNAPDRRFLGQEVIGADARAAGPNAARLYRARILERYQIHYPFILYVGNIRPQKNIPRLVEAFAHLIQGKDKITDHPPFEDLHLIIIGDEISRHPAVRLAAMHSRVDKRVRFLGFVPIDTLRVFYHSAAVFAFPSLYEGFGLPPLEAMAAGTPVVTSNVSSLPEVVGDAAVIVNPENVFDIARGLREALLDEDLRRKLVEKGYEQVKRFSWERTASEVLRVYREVAEQSGGL